MVILSFLLTAVLIVRSTGLRKRTLAMLAGATIAVAVLAGVGLSTWSGERFGLERVEQDLRLKVLPETIEAAKTYFPVGAGWGSFAQVYPRFESIEDLSPEYLNHTHSELTQIVIEGGVVAILLLLAFLIWYVRATWRAWAAPNAAGIAEARLCTILMLLPLVASITDYPLRTPLMACAFAVAAALLAVATRKGADAAEVR